MEYFIHRQIFDPENEGHITRESLAVILHNAFGMEEVDVEELFKQVDADHDGIISFGMCHCVTKYI